MGVKLGFHHPVQFEDKKYSAVNAFDDYFTLSNKKYRVIGNLGGKEHLVKQEKKKNSIPLAILKVLSYLTAIIPLIMLIGKAISRAQHNFYTQHQKSDEAASKIQSHVKTYLAKRKLEKLKKEKREGEAAIKIQKHVKSFLAKAALRRKKEASIKLQALARGTIARKAYLEKKQAATKIQAHLRGDLARKEFKVMLAKHKELKAKEGSAITIQKHVKGFLARKAYKNKTEMLKKVFNEERPAMAAWLIRKGADLKELETYAATIDLTPEKAELLNWLKTVSQDIEATPENLDHFALTLGYGYKSANLLVMQKKAEKMSQSLKSAQVKVPPFLPVGDYEMTHYMKKELPEVFTLWEKFKSETFSTIAKDTFLSAASDEQAAKAGLKISAEGEAILEQIKARITEHFSEKLYNTPQMEAWMKKEKPMYLIIRSTGKEDSDTNSNAGGNASIPYVKPDEKAVSAAIGEVIASYFGEKSINQRILCGDRSLFTDDKPFMPVLIQEMVGLENVAGEGSKNEDIPRSGVLFTRQSDKAEGVTFIQTGLGNNEGVVSSQVGVDSYYVKDGKINAVVRSKKTRFVCLESHSGKMTIEPIRNNNIALERSQALPPGVILDIKRVADDISATYSKDGTPKPMDMEYTVKLREKNSEKPVIYLLQARPLLGTQGEKKTKPSYLDLKAVKDEPKSSQFSGEVLLDGNAYVREITDPSAFIFADDLPKGEQTYSHADDPASKKVIVIKKTAPATSHEAVILRPKGVAVLVVSDPAEFAALKMQAAGASKENPMLVDTQRGMLVGCSDKDAPSKLIKKGLVSYPIPLEVTVPQSGIMNVPKEHAHLTEGILKLFNMDADKLITDLQKGQKFLPIAKKGTEGGYTIRELIDMIGTEEADQAKLALATLLKLMKNRLGKSLHETEEFRAGINRPLVQVFEAAVHHAKKQLIPAIENHPGQSLERLYPLKFLDAMLFQKASCGVMGGVSFSQVLALDTVQKKTMAQSGVNFSGPNGQSLLAVNQMSALAYNETCRENWQQIIQDLAEMDHADAAHLIARLTPILQQVNELGIGDKWMNTVFPAAFEEYEMAHAGAIESFIARLEADQTANKATFSFIKERMSTLDIYEKGTALWADPSYAKKNATKLKLAFRNALGFDETNGSSHSIQKVYAGANKLGKLAILQYMRDAVNTYDCIIKAVKGSDQFGSDKAKAEQVAELLNGYLKMLETTFQLVPQADQQIIQKLKMGSTVLFPEYLQRLKDGFHYNVGGYSSAHSPGFDKLVSDLAAGKLNAAEQMEARPEFAVDSLVVGSKADLNFSVRWPERLEEYFTTFHQNMEQVFKYLNTKNGLNTELLSETAKGVCDQFKKEFEQDISSLAMEDGKLKVKYQVPLRQHCAAIQIAYNPKLPGEGMEVDFQMFGNDEHRRWDQAAAFGAVLANTLGNGFVDGIPPKIDYKKPEGVSFSIKLPADFKETNKLIHTLFYVSKIMTMGPAGNPTVLLGKMQNGADGYCGTKPFKGLGKIDWSAVNPKCFKHTLHLNSAIMYELMTTGNNEAVAQVAINSLRGIADYGLTDYKRGGVSLRSVAFQELYKRLPHHPEIAAEVQKLVSEPEVQGIPVIAQLKAELAKLKTPEEAYTDFMAAGNYAEAFSLAVKSKNPLLIAQLESFIDDKLEEDTALLFNLVVALQGKGMESEADAMILGKGLESKLSQAQLGILDAHKLFEARKAFLTNLDSNVAALQKLTGTFEVNHEEIMRLCADSLIGLSQRDDYQTASFGGFHHLNGYLGDAKYNYIYDNQYGDTTKLRKAAPMYLIKGLESASREVHGSAMDAFKRLAKDYVQFASKNGDNKEGVDHVMCALARALCDIMIPSAGEVIAVEMLKFLFKEGYKDFFQTLAASGKITSPSLRQKLLEA